MVLKDRAFAQASIDRGTQIYARDRAKRDAENRAAREIAARVRDRLAAYFTAPTPPPPPSPPADKGTGSSRPARSRCAQPPCRFGPSHGCRQAQRGRRFLGRIDPARPVVLLFGPDAGLVAERAAKAAATALTGNDRPVRAGAARRRRDRRPIPARLADEAYTIGMFGGRRVIRVRVGGRSITAALEPLLADPPADTLDLLEAGDLKRGQGLREPGRALATRPRPLPATPTPGAISTG